MKNYKIFLIMLINILIQGTILQSFRIKGIMPNTNLIIIIIFSILLGKKEGLTAAVIGGFLQDILYGKAIGINVLIYLLIAFLVSSLEKKVFKENIITPIILFVASTFTYHTIYYIILYFFRYHFDYIHILTTVVGFEIIYNTVIGLVMYKISLEKILYSY